MQQKLKTVSKNKPIFDAYKPRPINMFYSLFYSDFLFSIIILIYLYIFLLPLYSYICRVLSFYVQVCYLCRVCTCTWLGDGG